MTVYLYASCGQGWCFLLGRWILCELWGRLAGGLSDVEPMYCLWEWCIWYIVYVGCHSMVCMTSCLDGSSVLVQGVFSVFSLHCFRMILIFRYPVGTKTLLFSESVWFSVVVTFSVKIKSRSVNSSSYCFRLLPLISTDASPQDMNTPPWPYKRVLPLLFLVYTSSLHIRCTYLY